VIIDKEIIKPIEQDAVFVSGKLHIENPVYFINKINQGIALENNLNYQTNVKAKVTHWRFFVEDKEFIKLFVQINDHVTSYFKRKYKLIEAWGNRHDAFDISPEHDHYPSVWSGVIYFSKSPQSLYFPEIKQELAPDIGSFAIFSSFLKHKTNTIYLDKPKFGISFNANHVN
jgi:hypothetical protein